MTKKMNSLRLAACFGLALGLAVGVSHWLSPRSVSAQGAAPVGSYSYLVTQSGGVAIVGVMNFDGNGNLTGTYTSSDPQGTGGSGNLTGNYTSNSNGVGGLSFAFDNGVGVQASYATNNGGSGFQVLFTGGAPGLAGNGTRQ